MTSMDIVEVSKRVYRFQKERVMELGVELTPELVFFHLSEEIGEIARQLVNRNLSVGVCILVCLGFVLCFLSLFLGFPVGFLCLGFAFLFLFG
jgi:hypothetical protein